jgi:hypothetical protein
VILVTHTYACSDPDIDIQGDSGEKVNKLGGHFIGDFERKVNMNMCLILIVYYHTTV